MKLRVSLRSGVDYRNIMNAAEGREILLSRVERYQFYDRAKTAYAIVATGETAIYGNLILKKGVIQSS